MRTIVPLATFGSLVLGIISIERCSTHSAGSGPSRLLAFAVEAFNARSAAHFAAKGQPPLSEKEVIAAIEDWQRDEEQSDSSDAADRIAQAFVALNTQGSFPLTMGAYSAILGFFIPSGGGKWLLEAPYVMQAANELQVHLGWAVQIYNASEALPNLINPFWMLPLLGILGLKARDIVGFSFLQLIVHLPVVLFLLWALSFTLPYQPPMMPGTG